MFSNLNSYKFHPLTIPLKDGSKFFVYFKLFNSQLLSSAPSDQSLYEILKNFRQSNNLSGNQEKTQNSEQSNELDLLPTKRTLLCINLDREFKEEKIKKLFRILGKIRKVYIGHFINKKKVEGTKKLPKTVYFSFIIFNKAEDVKKAFEIDWFQSQINEKYKLSNLKADQSDKEKYAYKILENYDVESDSDEKKNNFLEKMQEDGFTVVLNHHGTVNLNKKPSQMETLPKKEKKNKFLDNFYKFQNQAKEYLGDEVNIQGMDPTILMKRKKKKLIEDFEKDKEKLKKIKIN